MASFDLMNLEIRPATATFQEDEMIRLEVWAVADDMPAELATIEFIFTWDPAVLTFLDIDNTGGPQFDIGGLLDHSSGLNDDLTDGNAIFSGGSFDAVPIPPSGRLIVTLEFLVVGVTPSTMVDLPHSFQIPPNDPAETRIISADPWGWNGTGTCAGATLETLVNNDCLGTDSVPPTLTVPMDIEIECDESDDPMNTGQASATDDCDPDPMVTYVDAFAAGACPNEMVITRTWTAEDASGHMTSGDQIITVVDTTSPDVTAPADLALKADAGGCTATLSLAEIGTASATDNCSLPGDLTSGFTRSDGEMQLDAPFDSANSPITIAWAFGDECGNTGTAVQTVTVAAVNELALDLDLEGGVVSPVSRCVTLELFKCGGGSTTSSHVIEFTGGSFSGTLDVPCGDYDCVTVRDAQHSLRRTLDSMDGFTASGSQYLADFVSAGKDLVLGNLNDDLYIDIIDFGLFSGQWMMSPGPVSCPPAPPTHADISGDGTVFSEDFAFIMGNFQEVSEPNCCGLPLANGGPQTRVSLDELRRRGLGHLAVSDLNHDGWLDIVDMIAFLIGERPERTDLGARTEDPYSKVSVDK